MMRSSKDTAAYVALTKLGYQVPTETLGAVVTDSSPNTPAASAGLLPGDSSTAIDGVAICQLTVGCATRSARTSPVTSSP